MDDFLTPVSTTVKRAHDPEPALQESFEQRDSTELINLGAPEDIVKALNSKPDLATVKRILKNLATEPATPNAWTIVIPGPIAAQVTDTLVKTTIPDFWRTLEESDSGSSDLAKCLRNGNGLGAIISRLRPLIADCRQRKPIDGTRGSAEHIEDLIDVLTKILASDQTSSMIWHGIQKHAQNAVQKRLMWKEYVAQVASGRILSLVAEAEDATKDRFSSGKAFWLARGAEYASWLGRNLVVLVANNPITDDSITAVTELFSKALSLGYLGMYFV
jgi:telomere length regulation protein